MHKIFRRSMAILLSVLMTVTLMPYSTFPSYAAMADGDSIIDTAGITCDGAESASLSSRTITLRVAYAEGNDGDPFDVSSIEYDYNTSTYDSVRNEFTTDTTTTINGDSVGMYVYYTYDEDTSDPKLEYRTLYSIIVESDAPTFSGTISKSTDPNTEATFTKANFTDRYDANDGAAIASVAIDLPGTDDTVGTLMYGEDAYVDSAVIGVDDIAANLTFDPLKTGVVSYGVTAYDADGNEYDGVTLTITVTNPTAAKITYTTDENDPVTFNDTHFISACTGAVGGTFDYIEFPTLPATSKGKLYLYYDNTDEELVKAYSNYDDNELDEMTFVPYSGYTGTFTISYIGYNTSGEEYNGTIEIKVEEVSSEVEVIEYSTYENVPLSFDGEDFSDACDAEFDDTMDYVKFTLPSSTKGILYVSYPSSTKVSSTTKYDESAIDKIDFVPKSGYYGTFTITYTGYYDGGDESYSGEIEITVTEDTSDVDAILYEGDSGEVIDFDGGDFVDVFEDEFNDDFDYVKFTLPSSTYGILYNGYTSSTNYDSKVSATSKCDEDDLDDISFVPKSTYKGVVVINYKGYYNNDDDSYTGKVFITVGGSSSAADTISLTTKEDTAITFNEEKFNDVCEDVTSEELDYVKFTLPSTTQGKLYYNYTSASNYSSVVSSSTKYYYDGTPGLSKVTFVPYKDYYGTVTLKYTGYNVDGDSFSGTVKITITAVAEVTASAYFTDVNSNYAWAAPSIDALYKAGIVNGTGTKIYSPASNIIRGDFMLMLYRALGLRATVTGNFSDVPSGSYYYTAIAVAKSLGVAQGSGSYFYPGSAITREDAMVLVYRAMKADGNTPAAGSSANIASFADKGSISDYAVASVEALVKAGIIKGNGSYLYPKAPVTRAEMAVILYRVTQL